MLILAAPICCDPAMLRFMTAFGVKMSSNDGRGRVSTANEKALTAVLVARYVSA